MGGGGVHHERQAGANLSLTNADGLTGRVVGDVHVGSRSIEVQGFIWASRIRLGLCTNALLPASVSAYLQKGLQRSWVRQVASPAACTNTVGGAPRASLQQDRSRAALDVAHLELVRARRHIGNVELIQPGQADSTEPARIIFRIPGLPSRCADDITNHTIHCGHGGGWNRSRRKVGGGQRDTTPKHAPVDCQRCCCVSETCDSGIVREGARERGAGLGGGTNQEQGRRYGGGHPREAYSPRIATVPP